MAVYSLSSHIREQQSNVYNPRSKAILEEEINKLRVQMEKLVHAENSFTSDVVLQLSRQLDEKINEYNDYMGKNKQK
ncbi:MAG: aspartyl-phosphate phosphatase Spo0E family protein [Paenibacillaceae bacterium]